MVNFEWFRSFKAIYERGSLTAAAEALYVSQPGISLHLNSLEAYVGYKLFDRTSRKMIPTERAKVLYNFTLEAINKLEEAEQHFHRSTEKERPTISIGMCFETFQFTLESYLPHFDFNVIIKFGDYPQMLADLDAGILDLIITPQKGDYPAIQYEAFSKERIGVVGGAKTDMAEFSALLQNGSKPQIQDWLKKQLWYGTDGDMEHLRRFWHLNFGRRPDFKPNFIVPNISSIVRCLSSGEGLAVIPDFLAMNELERGNIRQVWNGFRQIENTIYFGTRKKTMYNNEIAQIKEVFLKEMQHI